MLLRIYLFNLVAKMKDGVTK